jgi:acetyl-CoA carboxylase, biotin carboxylase subunit
MENIKEVTPFYIWKGLSNNMTERVRLRQHRTPSPEVAVPPEVVQPINKVFIANRGDSAVRGIQGFEKRGIPYVVPYSFPDAYSLPTRMADASQDKGAEIALLGGAPPEESYTNKRKILLEARARGCDAIFLGFGFLAEDADFVRQCEEAGIRVLAPSSTVMEATGNKINARKKAKEIKIGRKKGIPVTAGTGNLERPDQVVRSLKRKDIRFPVILKDPGDGGGRGMVVAYDKEAAVEGFKTLKKRRGNKEVLMENYIENAAHVEIQIAADKYGNVVALGERDCSMQRNRQKIIEQSPSPNISPRMREQMQLASIEYARQVGYSGVGTWEYIVDMDHFDEHGDPLWYFMEINPRIQVEHGVTELQTGIDIVDTMIDIAEGRKLKFTQDDIKPSGFTIEARVYGEDPENGFAASSGKITELDLPEIDGLRIDRAVQEGETMSPWYDRTVFRLLAHADTKEEARHILLEGLSQTKVVGVHTNIDFDIELLKTDAFRRGQTRTRFIEKWWPEFMRDKLHNTNEIFKDGTYETIEAERDLDVSKLPQDLAVPSRRSDALQRYSEHRAKIEGKTGKTSAAEAGIVTRDGAQFVSFSLNTEVENATFGVPELMVLLEAVKVANERHLPLLSVIKGGGINNWQNQLGLACMRLAVKILRKYPPVYHVNAYAGGSYGGVNASLAGVADLQFAIDSPDSKIGFSGPFPVAKGIKAEPKTFKAADAYAVLPEGTHTPVHHFQMRNVDVLVGSLGEVSDKFTHLIHTLGISSAIVDPSIKYTPVEKMSFRQATGTAERPDQPGLRRPAWYRNKLGGIFYRRGESSPKGEVVFKPYKELTYEQKIEALNNPDRPSAADLIDLVFDDVVSLTSVLHIGGSEQYHPIIAAVATIKDKKAAFKDKKFLVVAQQAKTVVDQETGARTVKYDPQKPADWEYAERMFKFGDKMRLPLVLFIDTEGADSSPESEDRNQSHKIAGIIDITEMYPHPKKSINIRKLGSGGGTAFGGSPDESADLENALSYVSTPTVQYFILTGRWIDAESSDDEKKELLDFMKQLNDSTAQGRLKAGLIKKVIPEGEGGAHVDPRIPALGIRDWILEDMDELQRMSSEALLERRFQSEINPIIAVTKAR